MAGLFQVALGYTGAMVPMLKFVSPITICSVIMSIGLGFYTVGFVNVASCFPMGLTTMALSIFFSQFLRATTTTTTTQLMGTHTCGSRLRFWVALCPILAAMTFTWTLSAILTVNNVWEEGNACRTDGAADLMDHAAIFRIPNPLQWGGLQFRSYGIVPMFGSVFASMMESVGDYYACANVCGVPPPTPGIICRGLGSEGLGVMLMGLLGSGSGTTSSSTHVGAISLTRVGSRAVVQMAGLLMMLIGVSGKVTALLASLPSGIVGGMNCVVLGVLVAIGLSNLQHVSLKSDRNLFIIGFAMFNSLSIAGPSGYFSTLHPTDDKNPFGDSVWGDIAHALFSSPMVIALVAAFSLDNTIPGTPQERGLHVWASACHVDVNNNPQYVQCYSLPLALAQLVSNCGYLEAVHRGRLPDPPRYGWQPTRGDLWELFDSCRCCSWICQRSQHDHQLLEYNNDDDDDEEA